MACPVHIWAPLMAAALPFSRAARDRVRIGLDRLRHRAPDAPPPPREMTRWAPIAPRAARPAEERPTPR